MLCAASEVFSGMFRHAMIEEQTGDVMIPGISRKSFRAFLEFVYLGEYRISSFPVASWFPYRTPEKSLQYLSRCAVQTAIHMCMCWVPTWRNTIRQSFLSLPRVLEKKKAICM
jgi:hypothetical protein